MTPKIIFERAAPMYEAALRKVPDFVMPEDSVYDQKIEALRAAWGEWGPQVLKEAHTITKLDWMNAEIHCYVVSGTKASFSHPLTLKLYDTDEQMFDTFVHELLHQLLNRKDPDWYLVARRKFLEPYEQESKVTRNHIILHALHAQLVLNLFGQERLSRMLTLVHSPDYQRAWEIVHTHGREKILEEVFGYKEK